MVLIYFFFNPFKQSLLSTVVFLEVIEVVSKASPGQAETIAYLQPAEKSYPRGRPE